MKIIVDAGEAAERLEELIDLVLRADDVFICQGERPVAQLTALSHTDGFRPPDTGQGRGAAAAGTTSAHGDGDGLAK